MNIQKMKNLLYEIATPSFAGLAMTALLPSLSYACAVCFGGADGNLIKGFTWGIALLAILPFALMATLFGLIVFSIKKNKTHG